MFDNRRAPLIEQTIANQNLGAREITVGTKPHHHQNLTKRGRTMTSPSRRSPVTHGDRNERPAQVMRSSRVSNK
jgi:hypothetical protein